MKRSLQAVGVLLLVIVAIVLARGVALRSAQLSAGDWTPVLFDSGRAAERLAAAIRFASVSHQDPTRFDTEAFAGIHAHLARSYPAAHARLERETVNEWSLLYRWPGRDTELAPVLLAAHSDVVPADGERWTHPPFAGAVVDGVIWGRGAIDDKGSVIAIFEAVEALLARGFAPQRTVYVAVGHDEEQGGDRGAVAMAELLDARGVELAWVLDEGGAVAEEQVPGIDRAIALVGIAEKGYVSIGLEVESPGGHSSTPPRHTAAGELAAAVVALENEPLPARLDGVTGTFLERLAPELPFLARVVLGNRWLFDPLLEWAAAQAPATDAMQRTTTAVTILDAGVKSNVLPTRARAVVNFRIHPNDSVSAVAEHVRRVVANDTIELEVGVASPPREPSGVSPVDGEAFETVSVAIRRVFPEAVVLPYLVVGGTDARHYTRLTANVYRFAPFRLQPETMQQVHGIDEHLGAGELAGAVRFYAELLRSATGPPQPSSR